MLNDKKVALNGKITKYLRWPINLSVLWIVVTAIIFFIDKRAGVVMAFATILFIVIAIVMMLIQISKDILWILAQSIVRYKDR